MTEMAGASQEPDRPEPNPDTAREVFPVTFEKDFKDFRGNDTVDEGPFAPKSSSAPVSVESPTSPTGLEDVSEEDLVSPVPTSAEKDKSPTTTPPSVSTTPPSSAASSTGKTKQPAKT